jgi:cytochrome c553
MKALCKFGLLGLIALGSHATLAAETPDPSLTPDSIHIQRCSACHYVDGTSPGPEFPNIAGQYESYLNKALTQFKQNKREGDAMELIASLHKQQELVIYANYFAKQKPDDTATPKNPDQTLLVKGEHLYKAERVYGIACADCHGADAKGYVRKSPRRPYAARAMPRLAGQKPAYLMAVMQKYSGGTVQQGMCGMRKAGKTLSQDDVKALVEYLASK